MSFQHYLPAAYLGRFSEDAKRPLRERKLWALRRDSGQVFGSVAGKIAGEQGMYALREDYGLGLNAVDDTWGGYESGLASALDNLCDPSKTLLNAEIWLLTLIPFVAGMFVRTPEMNQRYQPRAAAFFGDDQIAKDQTNVARLTSLNRFLAPVMAARWYVLHVPPGTSLLVSDCGLTNVDLGKCLGWMVPIGPNQVLALEPMPDGYGRDIMFDDGEGDWKAVIHHIELGAGAGASINDSIVDAASELIIGGSKREVEAQVSRFTASHPRDDLDLRMLSTNCMQIVHAFDWHRAVTAIHYSSSDPRIEQFDFDIDVLADGWCPPLQFPLNLPLFNVGLSIHGKVIAMGMAEVPGFTDGFPPPWPCETSDDLVGPDAAD